MRDTVIYFLKLAGMAFLMAWLCFCLFLPLTNPASPSVVGIHFFLIALIADGFWIGNTVRERRRHLRAERMRESELTETFAPFLQSSLSPDVIDAAVKLGEARDVSAVPALIAALERCVEAQPPGWSEQAAALANALAQIGDRRALPLLYRLDNVRGIGLIPAVRNAIAAIEPQTSLLRAGSQYDVPPQFLLRSAQNYAEGNETAVLLRSADADSN